MSWQRFDIGTILAKRPKAPQDAIALRGLTYLLELPLACACHARHSAGRSAELKLAEATHHSEINGDGIKGHGMSRVPTGEGGEEMRCDCRCSRFGPSATLICRFACSRLMTMSSGPCRALPDWNVERTSSHVDGWHQTASSVQWHVVCLLSFVVVTRGILVPEAAGVVSDESPICFSLVACQVAYGKQEGCDDP